MKSSKQSPNKVRNMQRWLLYGFGSVIIALATAWVVYLLGPGNSSKSTESSNSNIQRESAQEAADRLIELEKAGGAIRFAWTQLSVNSAMEETWAEYNHLEDPCFILLVRKVYHLDRDNYTIREYPLDFRNILRAFVYGMDIWVVARSEPFQYITSYYPKGNKVKENAGDRILLDFGREVIANAVLPYFETLINNCLIE